MTIGAFSLPRLHHVVHAPGRTARARRNPASRCGGSPWNLTLARQVDPALRMSSGEQLQHQVVGARECRRIARNAAQRNGPRPSQNSGRMYSGTKPGKSNAFFTPCSRRRYGCCCRSRRSPSPSSAARAWLHVLGHGVERGARRTLRDLLAQLRQPASSVMPFGHVAVQGIVRARLVGESREQRRAAASSGMSRRSCRPTRPKRFSSSRTAS